MIVIYHGPGCADGFCAAWCAWLKYGDSAEYVPAQYGDAPPDVTGRDVLIVDFSFPRATIIEMARSAKSITIFDHHATAQEDLKEEFLQGTAAMVRVVFDMNRSGAGITWDELHGKTRPEDNAPLWIEVAAQVGKRPWLVDYAEDRDLWRFKLPSSKEVNEYLRIVPREFKRWSDIAGMDWTEFAHRGATLAEGTAHYVESMRHFVRVASCLQLPADRYIALAGQRLTTCFDVEGFSVPVPVVNCPPHANSELLGALASDPGVPFAVGWFQRADGTYQYSLRSRGDGGADVSAIAKAFGGGGHRNAAGFESKERVDS